MASANWGSSPRMRGARAAPLPSQLGRGIIPAYAGSTPRLALVPGGGVGSSPRMRGALTFYAVWKRRYRIIPAYAGSTLSTERAIVRPWDHPRVCGEHSRLFNPMQSLQGSSPRMRGAPPYLHLWGRPYRIIPAYAGSTTAPERPSWRCRDHPRVCGEHYTLVFLIQRMMGSSPRMRGAPASRALEIGLRRIIPAYAGSTQEGSPSPRSKRDHPRVCGEHHASRILGARGAGSSPRMRGARRVLIAKEHGGRIIPAYAGSTRWNS